MTTLQDENKQLRFEFDDNMDVMRYDCMSIYRNEIEKQISGVKAIDFVCVNETDNTSYFIEATNYSCLHSAESQDYKRGQKAEDMALEMSRKVLATISGLWLASHWNGTPENEKMFAGRILEHTIKVILHYELPSDWTETERKRRLADVKNKLSKKLRILGNSPLVVDCQILEENKNKGNLLAIPMMVKQMEQTK